MEALMAHHVEKKKKEFLDHVCLDNQSLYNLDIIEFSFRDV